MVFTEFFWDFDGTLFDTYGRITRAMLKGMADCGLEASPEEVRGLMKVRLWHACETFAASSGGRATAEELLQGYKRHSEEEGPESMRLYPGAADVLREIRRRGGRNYILTHRGETCLPALEREGIADCFTDLVTADMGFPAKPAPDGLNYLIEKHGLDRRQCVMIGDRDLDLECGVNAGIACALFDADGCGASCPTPYAYGSMEALLEGLVTGPKGE